MNNAIDRAIEQLDLYKTMPMDVGHYNILCEMREILLAMKEPPKKSTKPEMISIPKRIAYEYMQWAMGKPGYNQYATRRLESALDEALKDKQ